MEGITFTELRIAIEDAIDARGADYVDPNASGTCAYVDGDRPGCLIGTALFNLGVDLAELAQYEGDDAEDLPFWGDAPVRQLAQKAQTSQDAGYTWRESLNCALDSMGVTR